MGLGALKWIKAGALSTLAILVPIQPVLVTAFVLVVVDLVTGVLAARKRGERVKSAGLGRTVAKLLVYQAAIICGFLVEKYMLGGLIPLVGLIAGAIGVTELLSVLENAAAILGQPSIFRAVVDRLASKNDARKVDP